jgi:hypothetical protein
VRVLRFVVRGFLYCSARVLTMRFVTATELLDLRKTDADPARLARVGFRTLLKMVFEKDRDALESEAVAFVAECCGKALGEVKVSAVALDVMSIVGHRRSAPATAQRGVAAVHFVDFAVFRAQPQQGPLARPAAGHTACRRARAPANRTREGRIRDHSRPGDVFIPREIATQNEGVSQPFGIGFGLTSGLTQHDIGVTERFCAAVAVRGPGAP